ncbi:TIGR03016 family PEP-CTERM system-associated outer membrane protein [Congregibacter brevis]|uniref:TIGR03016 family PEP-CTERM system-associated outer membrane protein n=1 Tax=Congregibacter brevis TaxID=3081201 RepID=A0ABZ0IGJ5_9GAMM|nr:TIGR03016 family PEP-CTERM system-associated outer membrane protein [Congregibacter sp. IMCC45268]
MRCRGFVCSATVGLLAVLASHNLNAAEWTTGAGLSVGTYASSNICRAPDDEESKVVGTITPSVDLSGEGSRATVDLSAAVEYNTLGDSSIDCPQVGGGANVANREAWVPRIRFLSELDAVENLLVLTANASANQNAINPFVAGGDDNINATGNTNINYRWGLGARVDRQFNETLAVLASYNYNEQFNSANQVLSDSQEDRVDLDVGMIPEASRFSVGLRGQYSEVYFEPTTVQPEFTNRLSRLEVRSAFRVSDSWALTAYAGEEDNVFLSSSEDIDGSYWDVGVRWAPNARVEFNAGYGERFFGETPRFDVTYRHKRSEFTASYSRDLQFPRNIRVDDDAGLGTAFDLPGDPIVTQGNPTFVGQTPVLNERFALNYRFSARRTTFGLLISDSQQTRAEDGREGSFQSAIASFTRSLGVSLGADLRLIWRSNENGSTGGGVFVAQDLESWGVSTGLQKRLAKDTSLSLRYVYTDQTSSTDFNNFEEHRIDLSLGFRF